MVVKIKMGKMMKGGTDFEEMSKPLTEAIKQAQGRAQTRTITAGDIYDELMSYELRLHIPKKYMAGIRVTIDHNAQKFPNAYKYTPESTYFTAEHNGKEWIVTDIGRGVCKATKGSAFLPDEAKKAIIESMAKI